MAADPRRAKEPEEQEWSQETFETDQLQDLAREVSERRAKERAPLVERAYVTVGTDEEGTPRPLTETITKERFVDDLKAIRDAEVAGIEAQEDTVIRDAIDQVKGVATESEITAWQQQQELAAQQAQVQHQTEPLPEGVDREIFEALKNPKVAAALSAELSKVEESRRAFATAAFQAAQLSAAAVVSSTELSGLPPEQYAAALHLLEKQNPHRALEIRNQLQNVQRLYDASQQAKAQEQQLQAQAQQARLQGYMRSQEVLLEHSLKSENPETVKQVKSEIMGIIENEYGISREALAEAFRTNPALHSAAFQRMMFDTAKFKLAQRTAARSAPKPVPAVQRPGVAGSYHGDSEVESARSEFLRSPNPRNAARMIAARRRAS
jgi:hypothetical protein